MLFSWLLKIHGLEGKTSPQKCQVMRFVGKNPGKLLANMTYQAQVLQIFQESAKNIERLGWKNLDAEEFANEHIRMLKKLGALSEEGEEEAIDSHISFNQIKHLSSRGPFVCRENCWVCNLLQAEAQRCWIWSTPTTMLHHLGQDLGEEEGGGS